MREMQGPRTTIIIIASAYRAAFSAFLIVNPSPWPQTDAKEDADRGPLLKGTEQDRASMMSISRRK